MLLILFLLLSSIAQAQNGVSKIYGKIFDTERKPIKNVFVYLEDTFIGAYTNENGEFFIDKVQPGKYVLAIKCLGFKTKKDTVEIFAYKTLKLDFQLEEDVFNLEQTVVTGSSRLHNLKSSPAIIQVVEFDRIYNSGKSLNETLTYDFNFEIKNTIGRSQALQINGFNSNHSLILIDGEKVSGKVDGSFDLNSLPVCAIERIEILKGPYSALYGSEAMGGVLNIITRKKYDNSFAFNYNFKTKYQIGKIATDNNYGYLSLKNFSLNEHNFYLSSGSYEILKDEIKFENFDVGVSYSNDKGVDYSLNDNFSELPGYDKYSLFFKSNLFFMRNITLNVRAEISRDNLSWMSGDKYNPFNNKARNFRVGNYLKLSYNFNSLDAIDVSYNFSTNEHIYKEFYGKTQTLSEIQNETLNDIKVLCRFSVKDWTLIKLGVLNEFEEIQSKRIEKNSRFINGWAIYGESDFIFQKLNFNLGLRYSYGKTYGGFLSPKISIMYKANENINLRFSYGKGYRQPSLKELYINYVNSSVGYTVIGEPSLKPERSDGFNAGVEYINNNYIWIRANAYYNYLDNLIDWYYKGNNILSYYNVNKAIIAGIDAETNFRVSSSFSLFVKYDKIIATDKNKNILPFRTPNSLSAAFSYEYSLAKFNFRAKWNDKKKVTNAQFDKSLYDQSSSAQYFFEKAHWIFDFNVMLTLKNNLIVAIGIENIFDRRSYPFGPIRGREISVAINFKL